jgi:hypothetical protein
MDDLYDDALEIVRTENKASCALFQRKLGIGYARAARLLDLLEENGVIAAADGSRPREILPVEPEFKIDVEALVTAITGVSEAMAKIDASRLKRDVIVTLIHRKSTIPRAHIEIVLNNLESFDEEWLKKISS